MSESNDERAALQKLEQLLRDNKVTIFTAEEAATLQRLAKIFLALEVLGGVGRTIRNVLLWLGVIITAWFAFRNGVAEWVASLIR